MFEAGPYIDVVKALLNPAPIYAAMGYFSGLASLIFFLFPLFAAVRIATEASKMGLRSSIGEAFGDFASTTVRFMMYSIGGFIMFLILFSLQGFFENLGGTESLEHSISDFRTRILASREQQEDWLYTVIKFASDAGNTLTAPLFLIIYQVISCIYIFVKHLMQVVFALLTVLTFAYGYIAILTQSLPKQLNLIPGFIKSFLTLAIWVVIEPMALGLINLLQKPGQDLLVSTYGGGLGSTAINAWFLYTSVLLTVCILVLVAVPFIARALAHGEAMGGPLAAGAAALTGLLMNEAIKRGGESASAYGGATLGNMMPSMDGSRRRDTAFQAVADKASSIFQSDLIAGARNLMSGGLGDTTMASQPSSLSENSSSGSPVSGSSSASDTMRHSSSVVSTEQAHSLGSVASPTTTSRPMEAPPDGTISTTSTMSDATSRPTNTASSTQQQSSDAAAIYDSAQHDYSVGDVTQANDSTNASSVSDDQNSKNYAQPILDMLDEPPPSVNPEDTYASATTPDRSAPATSSGLAEHRADEPQGETKRPIKPPIQGLGDLGDNSHDDGRS